MTMHCIKVCREKKITYLSFARSINHNQDCKINEKSKINVVHRMCPNEILQTKSRDKSLYILQKKSFYIKLLGMFINVEFNPM